MEHGDGGDIDSGEKFDGVGFACPSSVHNG